MRRTMWITLLVAACRGDGANDGGGDGGDGAGDGADGGIEGAGECTVPVPPDAIVVESGDVVDATDGAVYWVCKSRNLSYSGDGAAILVEADGDVVLNGTGNTVWLKSGGGLALFQPNNDIRFEDEGDVNDESGGPTDLAHCPSLVFDYSSAPQPGCTLD